MSDNGISIDSLCPVGITEKTEWTWIKKASSKFLKTVNLWILGWMFVALGAMFAINTMTGLNGVTPYGIMKFLMWIAFCMWLLLVVTVWGELFTGNVLIVVSTLNKKTKIKDFAKNLVAVWIGNFLGSILIAWLLFFGWFYMFNHGNIWETALYIAAGKMNYPFMQAVFLWIMCNILVCLAILVSTGCRTTGDKFLGILLPIAWFVAGWFEHCVANMFFLPFAWIIKNFWDHKFLEELGTKVNTDHINLHDIFLNNLLPVTIGNFLGWAVFVWLLYWITYCKKDCK